MRNRSIARRLIATVLLLELLSALGITAASVLYERRTRMRAFEVVLRGRADSLLGAVGDAEDANDNVMLDTTEFSVPANDLYKVTEDGGGELGQSKTWRDDLQPGDSESSGCRPHDDIVCTKINGQRYRFVQLHRVRVVDPGDKGGGKTHHITLVYGASTEPVWGAINRSVRFNAITSFLLLVLTGLAIAWLLHRGLLPLRELAAQAEDVAPGRWEFHPPESARVTRELAPLTRSLETAVQRLEQSFKQQDRFIGDAAHELKTGVALVKSSLQLLSMRRRSVEEYEAGIERSLTDCERMEGIVAKMLTLARVENQQATPGVLVSSDLAASAAATAQDFVTISELRQVALSVGATETMLVRLTAEECGLLCGNLMLNAVQHSPAGSAVRVAFATEPGWVEMRVEDHGDGIEAAALEHVFERFYRGDPSRQRSTGGTGLGLAICKALVDKAGGTIAIESTVGVGTTVKVRLPQAA